MLPESLRKLIAAAGRARAVEGRRAQAEREMVECQRAALANDEERARADAAANAETAWRWISSPSADELRAAMREHQVERLRLGTWSLLTGAPCAVGFGTVSVDMVADAIAVHVHVVRPGYVGHRSRRVHSPTELADLVPALALAVLADDVRAGRVFAYVEASLSEARVNG
jgi:hypothetical protein